MPTTMLTLTKLGISSRSEIKVDREDDIAIITAWGMRYYADWRMFFMNNFSCPIRPYKGVTA